jgi:hypothetical protein
VVAVANGPIMLDLVTPWLTAAIEQNPAIHHIAVGGPA